MTDYSFILSKMHSGKEWKMDGELYEGITWFDGNPIPKAQLDAEYIAYQAANGYKDRRKLERPSALEQLELIHNEGMAAWTAMMNAIDARHPSP